MKAMVIHGHGGIEKLCYEDIPEPVISDNDVLIRLYSASLNRLDIWVRGGLPGLKVAFPHTLGSDGAGVVAKVGTGVRKFQIGDPVLVDPGISCGRCEFCQAGEHSLCATFHLLGEHVPGTFAEYVKVPQENVYPIPEGFSFEEAAAFPLTYLTAWRMLVTKARIRPAEDILILGIGGGVSCAALQIAKHAGARVIATSSSDEKLEKARRHGANFTINYRTHDFVEEVRLLTQQRGVDLVVNSVGGDSWSRSLICLAKGGRMVTCGATTGSQSPTDIGRIFWNQLTILGSTMGNRQEFSQVLSLVRKGKVRPIIDSVFPLQDAVKAIEHMESQKQFGKIVLKITD